MLAAKLLSQSAPASPGKSLSANDLLDGLCQMHGVVRASGLQPPASRWLSTGVSALDALLCGWSRGALSEIYGSASSGRTSLCLAALRSATRRGETCALVDASDAFDPVTAQKAGVQLANLLWVRCGMPPKRAQSSHFGKQMNHYGENATPLQQNSRNSGYVNFTSSITAPLATAVEQALRATDLLLQSGGFGLIVMDFCDIPAELVRKVPLTSWFRLSRAVEQTSTVLLLATPESCAQTCATLVLRLEAPAISALGANGVHAALNLGDAHLPSHARLLRSLPLRAEIMRSRATATAPMARRPAQKIAQWATRTAWAG